MTMMGNQHIDNFTRTMLADILQSAQQKSRDQRAEIILEFDGKMQVRQIQLKDFDWTEYPNVIAMSFVCETDDPEDYARYLFSPKYMSFQVSYGKRG